MAKKKAKIWTEIELIKTFHLERLSQRLPLLEAWLEVQVPTLNELEAELFRQLHTSAEKNIDFWNEETLKMRFISPILTVLAQFDKDEQNRYESFYDTTVAATVEGIYLQTETDFMLAKGIGDAPEMPYFHFQEYKRNRKSPPEPMAQLIEAFLIAQAQNQNGKPLYGLTIVGRAWQFVVMEGKKYAVSYTFDATKKEDLLKIIAILRKFKVILEMTLLI